MRHVLTVGQQRFLRVRDTANAIVLSKKTRMSKVGSKLRVGNKLQVDGALKFPCFFSEFFQSRGRHAHSTLFPSLCKWCWCLRRVFLLPLRCCWRGSSLKRCFRF